MYSLTLWQPWAYFVACVEKLVENRPWEPPRSLLNQRFAIHAGKKWDHIRAESVFDIAGRRIQKNDCNCGAVIATAELVMVVTSQADAERNCPGHGKWFMGPFGWILRDVRSMIPIPCRGFQKLWNLPEEIAERIDRRR